MFAIFKFHRSRDFSLKHPALAAGICALMLLGCRDDTDVYDLSGYWLVESYTYQLMVGTFMFNDVEGSDGGSLLLNPDGTGKADLQIPGIQTSGAQNIRWQHEAGRRLFSLDLQDGREIQVYDLLFMPDNRVSLSQEKARVFQNQDERSTTVIHLVGNSENF